MDFQSLKTMLIMIGRPQSTHQTVAKIKEIKNLISERALGKSTIFSIDERLASLKRYMEDIKMFHDLYFPKSIPMYSK